MSTPAAVKQSDQARSSPTREVATVSPTSDSSQLLDGLDLRALPSVVLDRVDFRFDQPGNLFAKLQQRLEQMSGSANKQVEGMALVKSFCVELQQLPEQDFEQACLAGIKASPEIALTVDGCLSLFIKTANPAIVDALIEAKVTDFVFENISTLSESQQARLAASLVDSYEGRDTLSKSLSNFNQLPTAIATELIQFGFLSEVVKNRSRFEELKTFSAEQWIDFIQKEPPKASHAAEQNKAMKAAMLGLYSELPSDDDRNRVLAKTGLRDWLQDSVLSARQWKFDHQVALECFPTKRSAECLFASLLRVGAFAPLSQATVDAFLALHDMPETIARNLNRFSGLNRATAERLMTGGWSDQPNSVCASPDSFELSHTELAYVALQGSKPEALIANLKKFKGLEVDVAMSLISQGCDGGLAVLDNLDSFCPLETEQFFALAKRGIAGTVAAMIADTSGKLDQRQIILGALNLPEPKSPMEEMNERLDSRLPEKIYNAVEFLAYLNERKQSFPDQAELITSDELIPKVVALAQEYRIDSQVGTLLQETLKYIPGSAVNKLFDQLVASDVFEICVLKYELMSHPALDLKKARDSLFAKNPGSLANAIQYYPEDQHQEIAEQIIDSGGLYSFLVHSSAFKLQQPGVVYQKIMDQINAARETTQVSERRQPNGNLVRLASICDLFEPELGTERILRDFKALQAAPEVASMSLTSDRSLGDLVALQANDDVVHKLLQTLNGLTKEHIPLVCEFRQKAPFGIAYEDGIRYVHQNISRFKGVNQREFLQTLLKRCLAEEVIQSPAAFTEISGDELLSSVLDYVKENQPSGLKYIGGKIANYLYPYKDLSAKLAVQLCELGSSLTIVSSIKCFTADTPAALVPVLINVGQAALVFEKTDVFQEVPLSEESLDRVISQAQGGQILSRAEKYKDFLTKDRIERIIRSGFGSLALREREVVSPHFNQDQILEIMADYRQGSNIITELPGGRIVQVPHHVVTKLARTCRDLEPVLELHRKKLELRDAKAMAAKFGIRLVDYLASEDLAIYNKQSLSEADYKEIYQYLVKNSEYWKDAIITNGFEAAAERVGYRSMFKFMSRSDVSHHDCCFALPQVLEMFDGFNQSAGYQLTDRQLGDFLLQVTRDISPHQEGKSIHRLNALAHRGVTTPADLLTTIESDPELACYENLIRKVKTAAAKDSTLRVWRELVAYADLSYFITHEGASLKKVSQLKADGKPELANYFERIAFYPGSKVDIRALFQFVDQPEVFLGRPDHNDTALLHNIKKPSNYLEVLFLGLRAEEIRDAIVGGALDTIQALPAYELTYDVAKSGKMLESDMQVMPVPELLLKILGSERLKITGLISEASARPYITAIQNQLYEVHKAEQREGQVRLFEVIDRKYEPSPAALELVRQQLWKIVKEHDLLDTKFDRYLVKVHKKSSPDAVVAGDDTACCMKYGHGKNIVYTVMPNCLYYTIQQVGRNGLPLRTVAQSVLTLNFESGVSVPDLFLASRSSSSFSELVPEKFVSQSTRTIVCDSIETNKNFIDSAHGVATLRTIYEDFFARYLAELPDQLVDGHTLDRTKVLIGKKYPGPFAPAYTELKNTFVPLTPVAYSDNILEQAYLLPLRRHYFEAAEYGPAQAPTIDSINEQGASAPAEVSFDSKSKPKSVSQLTYHDCLTTTYLESKVYHDNPALIVSLHVIQNTLLAKDIANVQRGTPNLSFKYLDQSGTLQSYMLAYEGRQSPDRHDVETPKMPDRLIYIYDFAAKKRNSVEAGKVLLAFVEQYKRSYIEQGDFIPLLMDARESTSYRLVLGQLQNIGKRLGCTFEIKEFAERKAGGEAMHRILITPVKAEQLS